MFYLLLGLGVCIVYFLFIKNSNKEPPMLSGCYPIIGNILRIVGDGVALYKAIHIISDECTTKGGVIKFNFGPITSYYILTDPDDALTLANTCLKKHFVYDLVKPIFGNGLLTADVPMWKKHRKLLNPAFSQNILDCFMGIFNSQAQSLTHQLERHLGKEFDHDMLLRINSLETICSAATGVDSDEYENLQKRYLPSVDELLRIFTDRLTKFFLHSDLIFNWSSLKKQQDKELEHVIALSSSMVRKKKHEMDSVSQNINKKSEKVKSFIDHLLELTKDEKSFTEEQIISEINNIIFGGHDTCASALSFTFTLLGSYADVQEKAYDEILQVLGKADREVATGDLSKLVYIEAILKETLRLYPSGPIIVRQTERELQLKNWTLKADTGCFISIHGLLRHSIWGADANDFRPERWFEKETLPDAKYYAAFALGRRFCIGKKYAMMSMKTVLVHVLRQYHISSDVTKMTMRTDIVTKPESGHHITIRKRLC